MSKKAKYAAGQAFYLLLIVATIVAWQFFDKSGWGVVAAVVGYVLFAPTKDGKPRILIELEARDH